MLRALGYDDSKGEFSWSEAIDFSLEKEIISDEESNQFLSSQFKRDNVAKISYEILSVQKKDGILLGKYLVDQGAIDLSTIQSIGIDISDEEENSDTKDVIEEQVPDDGDNSKFDENIFNIRTYENIEIAEGIRGSLAYVIGNEYQFYDSNLHDNKILKHGVSNLFTSSSFIDGLTGLNIVSNMIFEEDKMENYGAVNICDTGLKLWNVYSGNYFVDDYLTYIQPVEIEDGFIINDAMSANYATDEKFSVIVNMYPDATMKKALKAIFKNLVSDNQNADQIADFIVGEVVNRMLVSNDASAFSQVVDKVRWHTEMYVDGYFLSIDDYSTDVYPSIHINIK